MADFTSQIQAYIFASEGGYVDHPKDPGGATNMGITHKTLAAWRKVSPWWKLPKEEVKNLTRREATQIYEAQYWRTVGADKLPAGLDYAVADYGVNSGPARAVKDLQRAVGVAADGVVGVQTLAAVRERPVADVIKKLTDRRLAFIRGLSTYKTFGKGWETRIASVRAKAIDLTKGIETMPVQSASEGKATPQATGLVDVAKDPGSWSGIASALAMMVGAIANQPILQIGALLLIGVLLWRFVLVRKNEDPT